MKQNVTPMAGYCMESALWKMLMDLSRQMMDEGPLIFSLSDVMIEENKFLIDNKEETKEKEAVWLLGALMVYMSSGRKPYGGRGLEYLKSHKDARIPELCKEHHSLARLLHTCLTTDDNQRISLDRLYDDACKGYDECLVRNMKRKRTDKDIASTLSSLNAEDELWPEEME